MGTPLLGTGSSSSRALRDQPCSVPGDQLPTWPCSSCPLLPRAFRCFSPLPGVGPPSAPAWTPSAPAWTRAPLGPRLDPGPPRARRWRPPGHAEGAEAGGSRGQCGSPRRAHVGRAVSSVSVFEVLSAVTLKRAGSRPSRLQVNSQSGHDGVAPEGARAAVQDRHPGRRAGPCPCPQPGLRPEPPSVPVRRCLGRGPRAEWHGTQSRAGAAWAAVGVDWPSAPLRLPAEVTPWGVHLVGAPWPQPGRTVSLGTVTCHPSGGFCDVSSVLDMSNSWLSGQRRGNRGVTAPAWAASSGQHDVTEVALGRDAQRAREPVPTPPAVPGDGSSIADGGNVDTGFCSRSPPPRWAQPSPSEWGL